jgi:hypothetical protein
MKIHMKETQKYVKLLVSAKAKGKVDSPYARHPLMSRIPKRKSTGPKPAENKSVEKSSNCYANGILHFLFAFLELPIHCS